MNEGKPPLTVEGIATFKAQSIHHVCVGVHGVAMQTMGGRCYQWALGDQPTWQDEAGAYAKAFMALGVQNVRLFGLPFEVEEPKAKKAHKSKSTESATA